MTTTIAIVITIGVFSLFILVANYLDRKAMAALDARCREAAAARKEEAEEAAMQEAAKKTKVKEIIRQNELAEKNAEVIWTMNNGVQIREFVYTYLDGITAVVTFFQHVHGGIMLHPQYILFGKKDTLGRKIGYYFNRK